MVWKFCTLSLYWIYSIITEAIALISALLLYPLGWSKRYQIAGEKGKGTPILLVHGYLHNSSAWPYIRNRLQRAGHGPIYTINLGHPFRSLQTHAGAVHKKVEEIRQATSQPHLILIGHSMGGVVASLYAATIAPRGVVKQIITLGSPLKGTLLAHIALGRCGRELIPGSPTLHALAQAVHARTDLQFHHITSNTDGVVFPPKNTCFDGTKSHYVVNHLGHMAILYAPSISDQLLYWMRPSSSTAAKRSSVA